MWLALAVCHGVGALAKGALAQGALYQDMNHSSRVQGEAGADGVPAQRGVALDCQAAAVWKVDGANGR